LYLNNIYVEQDKWKITKIVEDHTQIEMFISVEVRYILKDVLLPKVSLHLTEMKAIL